MAWQLPPEMANTYDYSMPQYFRDNPDVAAAYKANSMGMTPQQFAQQHYNLHGSKEGRAATGSSYFDQNPDVGSYWSQNEYNKTGGMTPEQLSNEHWQKFGQAEGRAAPGQNSAYFSQNPDVAKAYATDSYNMSPDYFSNSHWYQHGAGESRAAPAAAGATDYFAQNPDVAKAYGQDNYGMTPDAFANYHWANYGKNEERNQPANYVAPAAAANPSMPAKIGNAVLGGMAGQYGGAAATASPFSFGMGTAATQPTPNQPTAVASPSAATSSYGGTGIGSSSSALTGGYTPPAAYTPPPAPPAPAPIGGATPLTSTVNAGFGMGVAPFQSGYLDNVGQTLWAQGNKNLSENVFPSMDQSAITAGGYGGDRAALAKGYAANQMNQTVANAMAPQYASSYNNWLDRGVQTGQAAGNLMTNLGQLDTANYNADTNRQNMLGNLSTANYNADTQRQTNLGTLGTNQYLADTQRQLGLGNLGVEQYRAQTGQTNYTNPASAALGGAAGLWSLWNSIFNPKP